jgi:hypothetical protein
MHDYPSKMLLKRVLTNIIIASPTYFAPIGVNRFDGVYNLSEDKFMLYLDSAIILKFICDFAKMSIAHKYKIFNQLLLNREIAMMCLTKQKHIVTNNIMRYFIDTIDTNVNTTLFLIDQIYNIRNITIIGDNEKQFTLLQYISKEKPNYLRKLISLLVAQSYEGEIDNNFIFEYLVEDYEMRRNVHELYHFVNLNDLSRKHFLTFVRKNYILLNMDEGYVIAQTKDCLDDVFMILILQPNKIINILPMYNQNRKHKWITKNTLRITEPGISNPIIIDLINRRCEFDIYEYIEFLKTRYPHRVAFQCALLNLRQDIFV